ncbi:MAG: hypothetical protein H6699_01015 [Myxococcales bacterium]|nr:hypothetical protein [Myxococcales bacterium]
MHRTAPRRPPLRAARLRFLSVQSAALALALALAACGESPAPGDGTSDAADALDAAGDSATDGSGGAPTDVGADILVDGDATDVEPVDVTPDVLDAAPADVIDAVDVDPGPPLCVFEGCPAGFECFTVGCLPVIAVGDPCSREAGAVQCAARSACLQTEAGDRCVPHGVEGGYCRGYGPRPSYECRQDPVCDPGLGCDRTPHSYGECRPGLPVGSLCGAPGDLCVSDTTCADLGGTMRCLADGAEGGTCRTPTADTPSCDGTLVCAQYQYDCVRGYDRCVRRVAAGESCASTTVKCDIGLSCISTSAGAICAADGAPGGQCRPGESPCDEGAYCISSFSGAGPLCRRPLVSGDVCDPTGASTACPGGETCNADSPLDPAVCVAAGTAPGASCRADEPRCEAPLTCSDFSRYRQSCRDVGDAGDPCDLGALRTVCVDGTTCAPVRRGDSATYESVCVAAAPEQEPNGRDDTVLATTATATYAATWSGPEDEDCFAVTLGAPADLWLELAADAFRSTTPVASLWDATGEELGRWALYPNSGGHPLAGKARLDAQAVPLLAGRAAGEYRVCLRGGEGAYGVTVGVVR